MTIPSATSAAVCSPRSAASSFSPNANDAPGACPVISLPSCCACTYLLEADDRLPIRVKADENSAVRWIPLSAVEAEVREPEMRVVYRKLMEKARLADA